MISGSSPAAPRCAAGSINVNLTVRAPAAAARGPLTPEWFPAAPRSLWRFRRLLPLPDAEPITLGEGATPLVPLERLGRRLGVPQLYAKDESQNPTWSYKDRLCSLAVTHAVATGAQVITSPPPVTTERPPRPTRRGPGCRA
jgi:threonine synthase